MLFLGLEGFDDGVGGSLTNFVVFALGSSFSSGLGFSSCFKVSFSSHLSTLETRLVLKSV